MLERKDFHVEEFGDTVFFFSPEDDVTKVQKAVEL